MAGPNDNFAPAFTVPGTMTLLGYTRDRDKPVGTKRYSTVRVKVNTPFALAKEAAVRTAIETFTGAQARFFRSGFPGAEGYTRIDIVFGKRANATSYQMTAPPTAAQVTVVLGNAAGAIAA